MALDGAPILITGGCGQVGMAIIDCLQERHPTAKINVLDLTKPVAGDTRFIKNVTYFAANITSEPAVRAVFDAVQPLVVFHTAGLIPQIAKRLGMDVEKHYTAVNFHGTKTVLKVSEATGSVKALVYTSSVDVVKSNSWQNLVNVDESMPIPETFDNPYAKSKAAAEILVLSSSSNSLPTTALRTHGVFGPHDSNLLPLMLSAPRNVHFGHGTNLYDFTFAPNLALAQILAAKNLLEVSPANASNSLSAAGKPFFITNCEPMPFRHFLDMLWGAFDKIGSSLQKGGKEFTIPTRVALAVVWIYQKAVKMVGAKPFLTVQDLGDSLAQRWFDNSSAKRVLGYVPEVTVSQALDEAAVKFHFLKKIMPGQAKGDSK